VSRRRFLQGIATASAAGLVASAAGCSSLIPRALATSPLSTLGDFDVAGRIAYVAGNDIFVWSNGSATRLTKDSRWEGPDWSPDGKLIAASLMGGNQSEVVILDTTGQRVRQITSNSSNVSIAKQSWGRKPSWSPDGTKVAYISDNGQVADAGYKLIDMSLFMVDADGKNLKKLVVPGYFTGGVDWPTWSPDGKQIAYDHFETSKPSQVYAYTFSSDRQRGLTSYPEGAYAPAWSPDGRWIAFIRRSQGKNDVYVLPVGGGGDPVKLTDTGDCAAPCWSPDGNLLAYIVQTQDAAANIMVLKLDTSSGMAVSGSKQLTNGEPVKTTSGLSWTS
jgi:TolB protein